MPYWRLSGYYFFHFAFIGAFLPYFGLYLQSIGFSAWDIGVLMSLMNVMRLFSPALSGWLADGCGRRVIIVRLAALVSLAGFSFFFWLHGFAAMVLAMAILSFFWSAALPLVEALTFSHLREAGSKYGRIRLWGSVGFIVAVLGTGAWLDMRPVSSLLSLICLLLAAHLALALTVPEAAPLPCAKDQPGLRTLLGQRRIQAMLAASFVMAAAHGAFYIFLSIHLAQKGYGKGQVGVLWTLGVLAEIVLFLLMPRLMRIFSLRWILLGCFAAAVLRFLLIGWCADWFLLIVLAQLLHALTFGAHHAASIAAISRWFTGGTQARGQALYSSFSFGAGGLLGGLIAGGMWDAMGAGWVFTVSAVFALCGFLLILFGVRLADTFDTSGTGMAGTQMR